MSMRCIQQIPLNTYTYYLKKEQNIEINAILKNYRGINRKNERNHTYIKLIEKIFWLANQVPL